MTMLSRRRWLQGSAAAACTALPRLAAPIQGQDSEPPPARIAITLDLEMARNFPTWESTHWDYEKGNLNAASKQYAVEAGRRVKQAGGVIHYFVVGQVFEQASVDWLKQLADDGHPIGNHTYDHVNVTATTPESLQYRFQRAPWLLREQPVREAIRENIRLCELAIQRRLGIQSAGFRTPGGFPSGLRQHPEIRQLLRDLGFHWVSSLYPPHAYTEPHQRPSAEVVDDIVAAQALAQPFVYEDGLLEIPMSPISDIGAFRTGRWRLPWFLDTIRSCVQWAIDHRAVFDFLAHPSCLYVVDPEFQTIEMICELVNAAGSAASLVSLSEIAADFA